MANRKTAKKKRLQRLKHLKDIYNSDPEALTPAEWKELKEGGCIK